VVNLSATTEEDSLRKVGAAGWLSAQKQATARQMCSDVCVLPRLSGQPFTYRNCMAWGGL